jgi:hypothetical protein
MSDEEEVRREKAAKTNLERLANERRRSAREAVDKGVVKFTPPKATSDDVIVRVLPMGDGKVNMGVHVKGVGEAHYKKGEKFPIGQAIAIELEERGFVEIEDPPAK